MSLHAELKEATRHQHEATEQLLFPRQDWSALSLDEYRQFLQIQYVFHQRAESLVDVSLNPELKRVLHWSSRRKLSWLKDDLREVSGDVPPALTKPEAAISEAAGMGLLYVTEGATLGGRMIKKVLRSNEHISPYSSFRFLSGYGEDTSRYWKSFLEVLEKTDYETAVVIAAARAGFDLFTESIYHIQGQVVDRVP